MKTSRVWLLLCILSVLSVPAVSTALPPDITITKKMTGQATSFKHIVGKHRLLKSRAQESGNTADQVKARKAFHDFLRNTYSINRIPPDNISFDAISNSLVVDIRFPVNIKRMKGVGPGLSSKTLYIVLNLRPDVVVDVLSNKRRLRVDVHFHMDTSGDAVLDRLKVHFRGKEIYAE